MFFVQFTSCLVLGHLMLIRNEDANGFTSREMIRRSVFFSSSTPKGLLMDTP